MKDKSVPVFVGLDYHMRSIQVCVLDRQGTVLANRSVSNDWQKVVALVRRVGGPVRSAIESCAGAADLAEQLVALAGWSVNMAHPGYVNRMKQNPDKTDYTDARMLADLERVGYLPRVWLAPHATRELRKLVRYRHQLVGQRQRTKMRISAILREHRINAPREAGGRWCLRWLQWLAECDDLGEHSRWIVDRHLEELQLLARQISQAERRLRQVTKDDPMIHALQGQSGIGEVTSWVIRAVIGRFDRFRTAKQLCRFCGLTPRNASSGERQADAGLIKAGDEMLRATLIQAAHRLVRFDPRWQTLKESMKQRGKKPCVIVAAVANRWMRHVFHQMKEMPVESIYQAA